MPSIAGMDLSDGISIAVGLGSLGIKYPKSQMITATDTYLYCMMMMVIYEAPAGGGGGGSRIPLGMTKKG